MKYDVITIGSATRDVFFKPEEAYLEKGAQYKTGKGICFSLGSKIDVPDIKFRVGGSAVNTAITFSKMGLRAAILCKVGDDTRGRSIERSLRGERVNTDLIIKDKKYLTAYSIILVAHGQRTVLVHRGATEHLCCGESVPFDKLKESKWLYITNLGGESAKIFEPIISFAHENGIKIALNPGKAQLNDKSPLKSLLDKINILVLNQEEASYLTGISFEKSEEIFNKLNNMVKGFIVMTRGVEGFIASDNEYVWRGGILKEPIFIDRTGAGDAFGSGFVSGIIMNLGAEKSFQLASSNSTGVLGEWGANKGGLSKDDDIYKFGKLEMEKVKI